MNRSTLIRQAIMGHIEWACQADPTPSLTMILRRVPGWSLQGLCQGCRIRYSQALPARGLHCESSGQPSSQYGRKSGRSSARGRQRRIKVATRLHKLQQEAWARGETSWMPYGIKAQLAEEFGVSYATMRNDLAVIETWPDPEPPRRRARDPRFQWARARTQPKQFPHRITIRISEDPYQRLVATGNVSVAYPDGMVLAGILYGPECGDTGVRCRDCNVKLGGHHPQSIVHRLMAHHPH